MDIHEGPEEEGVADREDDDTASPGQMALQSVGALVIELAERRVVVTRLLGEVGGHRIAQLLLDHLR